MDAPTMFRLSVDGFGAPWVVQRLEGRERIHAAFSFAVTCAKPARDDAAIDLEALLSRPVRLTWPAGDGSERVIVGFVDRAEAVHSGYRVVVVPRVAELADVVDHRVFLAMDSVAIAEEVLGNRHVHVEKRLSRALPARPQTVQFFESSLDFVSRLLAEEGIAWCLKSSEPDVVVLADHPSGYDPIVGESTLRVAEDAGLFGGEAVARVRVRSSVTSDHVSMRDYDFEHPKLDQTVEAAEEGGRLEVFSYPGGYADPSEGQALARIRLEEARAERVVLEAETSCRRLIAGQVLTLTQGARAEINQRWLLVEVVHEFDGEGPLAGDHRYVARFRAVPASGGYRPARVSRPRPQGAQTATVTGPAGAEIHTETHGRVTAQLRWDRRASRDERSSHWMRVAQPPTSGSFLLPRLGWEVLVGFSGSSADAPLVLGRLSNGEAPPPESLPARKVVGVLGSLTTPKGGSANVLHLDDAAGNERMGWAASSDYNERTENDKVTGIAGMDAHSISGARTLIVGTVHQVAVAAAQSYAVGGSREVNVDANASIVAASESVRVGGGRTFTIAGDLATSCGGALTRLVGGAKAEAPIEHQSRSVAGASTISIGAAWRVAAGAHASVSVLGTSIEEVAGPKNIVCGNYNLSVTGALNETMASRSVSAHGDRGEQFGGAASYTIGGAAKLSGSDVIFKAKAKITIRAGGTTITLTPGSITIDGEFSGSVASEDHGAESIG